MMTASICHVIIVWALTWFSELIVIGQLDALNVQKDPLQSSLVAAHDRGLHRTPGLDVTATAPSALHVVSEICGSTCFSLTPSFLSTAPETTLPLFSSASRTKETKQTETARQQLLVDGVTPSTSFNYVTSLHEASSYPSPGIISSTPELEPTFVTTPTNQTASTKEFTSPSSSISSTVPASTTTSSVVSTVLTPTLDSASSVALAESTLVTDNISSKQLENSSVERGTQLEDINITPALTGEATPSSKYEATSTISKTEPTTRPTTTRPTTGLTTTRPTTGPTTTRPTTGPTTTRPTTGPTTTRPTTGPTTTRPTTTRPTTGPTTTRPTTGPTTTRPTTGPTTTRPTTGPTTTRPTTGPTTTRPTTGPTTTRPSTRPTTRLTTQTWARKPTHVGSSGQIEETEIFGRLTPAAKVAIGVIISLCLLGLVVAGVVAYRRYCINPTSHEPVITSGVQYKSYNNVNCKTDETALISPERR